jgi:hypothetical protein
VNHIVALNSSARFSHRYFSAGFPSVSSLFTLHSSLACRLPKTAWEGLSVAAVIKGEYQ